MANITITKTETGTETETETETGIKSREGSRLKSTLWFVALWCVGVGGAMLLALPFKLLIQAATR